MKSSTKHAMNPGILASGLLLALAAGCASAADPSPSAEETSPSRSELMAALGEHPGDAAIVEALKKLDHEEAVKFGLLTEVTAPDGHVIQFLEPEEGFLVIAEKYKLGESSAVGTSSDVTSIWQRVAPNREMPPALAKLAAARVSASALEAASGPDPGLAAAAEPADEAAEVEGEPSLALDEKHVTSSGAHFRDDQNACAVLNSSVKRSWCWLNRTGTWTESKSAEGTAQVAACYAGPGISFTVKVGSKSATTTVLPGEIRSAVGTVSSVCVPFCYHPDKTISGTVTDTQGASWHWGGSISGDWFAQLTSPWTLNN